MSTCSATALPTDMRVIQAETSVRYHEHRNASAAAIALRGPIRPIQEESIGSERIHLSSKQRWQAVMVNPSQLKVSQTTNKSGMLRPL